MENRKNKNESEKNEGEIEKWKMENGKLVKEMFILKITRIVMQCSG